MTPLSTAALRYAATGVAVLPLHSTDHDGACDCGRSDCDRPGKHPQWHPALLPHGLRDASTRPDRIRRWWGRWPLANIGLRTGERFDVCDIDSRDGLAALRDLIADHPIGGPLVRSGSGGWHLYLRPTGVGNRTALLPGVDWRGVGGYVVAPPSRHASGDRYRWIRPPGTALTDPPPPLASLLHPPPPIRTATFDAVRLASGGTGGGGGDRCVSGGGRGASRGRDGTAANVDAVPGRIVGVRHPDRYAAAALTAEAAATASALPGHRNTTLYLAAHHLGQLAAVGLLDDRDIVTALADAAHRAGLGRRETARTVRSGLRAGHRRPRLHLTNRW
ncbi:bifunctional DNA primase/polymerase [Solwaraspora sp. WMMD1047]|uniref:bifunctional DNA primase/polymerase n=1 Tax=Solwaraspora sp. WMMD1047 TaxID=3016102 RepID=UPI002416F5A2|nr:bifunctional DNA primase/polymerase [Solwaraspora sp. WMMD1047]MDG4831516.1 bifunctional DNA primase/polymerase [Solwaraspora sp. WMMD1047]